MGFKINLFQYIKLIRIIKNKSYKNKMGAETSQQTQNKDEPILIENENEIKQNETLTDNKKEEIENENEIFKDNKKEEILETKGIFHPSRAADETVIKIQIPQTIKEQLNNSEFILILDISVQWKLCK